MSVVGHSAPVEDEDYPPVLPGPYSSAATGTLTPMTWLSA